MDSLKNEQACWCGFSSLAEGLFTEKDLVRTLTSARLQDSLPLETSVRCGSEKAFLGFTISPTLCRQSLSSLPIFLGQDQICCGSNSQA